MRRLERELVTDYEAVIGSVLDDLSSAGEVADADVETAVALAALPDMVRGFERLKLARVSEYRSEQQRLLDRLGRESGMAT